MLPELATELIPATRDGAISFGDLYPDRSVEDWQAEPGVDALTDAIMAGSYVAPTSAQILATIR